MTTSRLRTGHGPLQPSAVVNVRLRLQLQLAGVGQVEARDQLAVLDVAVPTNFVFSGHQSGRDIPSFLQIREGG